MISGAVSIAKSFEQSLCKLAKFDQARVKQTVYDFMTNPDSPGLRWHVLNMKEKRFASISVNMDIRVIVLRDGQLQTLMYVGHHDVAYGWAERRKVENHPRTGAAQIVEFEEVIREEIKIVPRTVEAPALFADEDDDYLLSLGVPQSWIGPVKSLDEDGLVAVLDRLPEEAAEALMHLHSGERPGARPKMPPVENGFDHPDAKRRFYVATDEGSLKSALDYPWDQWMTFLHPSQRDAVELSFEGPARISGGAGTGKTVVAIHRAVRMARENPASKVLLTTYSRALVSHLERALDVMLGSFGDIRRRISVKQLHAFAYELAREKPNFGFAPLRRTELEEAIGSLFADRNVKMVSEGFVRAEFDAIVDYWGIDSLDEYEKVQRFGRGKALLVEQRRALWPIFEALLKEIATRQRMTWSDLAGAAVKHLEDSHNHPFDFVIADEAQDFGPRELNFLLALAPVGRDRFVFCADIGQRIYRYPFSWPQAGVDTRGRSLRLSVNYRTTRQIKGFADEALGTPAPDFEEVPEERTAISLLDGAIPRIDGFSNQEEEIAELSKWLEELITLGLAPSEIALLGRTSRVLEEVCLLVTKRAGVDAQLIGSRSSSQSMQGDRVAVGTFHMSKGLEYRAVAIVSCEDKLVPHRLALDSADDDEGREIANARERQLFYVAATRARDILFITYTGTPSLYIAQSNKIK